MKLTPRPNKAGYGANGMGSIRSAIVFGGSTPGMLVANLNVSFHVTAEHPRGEAYLNLNHINSGMVNASDVSEINGKIIHSTNGFKHEVYCPDGDRFKWNIVFPNVGAVPDTHRLRIKDSGNLNYGIHSHKGIDLTGIINPQYDGRSAENSITVSLIGKKHGKYQTGIVCRIRSPYYVDGAGAESPLLAMAITPDIDNAKMLTLTHSPDVVAWLNDANRIGEITLDPDFGYSQKGGSFGALSAQRFAWRPWLADESFDIEFFKAWCGPLISAGNVAMKLGLSDVGAGPLYLASGQDIKLQAAGQAKDDDILVISASGFSIVAGTRYRMIQVHESNQSTIYFDTGLFGNYENEVPGYSNFNVEIIDPYPVTGIRLFRDLDPSIWTESAISIPTETRSRQAQHIGIRDSLKNIGSGQARNISTKGGF